MSFVKVITKRIGTDAYVRPVQTFTEKLTDEEIESKLEDYKKVDDISQIQIGTHLRYFILKNGKKLFRLGGVLQKVGLPDYIILSNGTTTWTVQVKDTIFFRKMSQQEIKDDYKNQLMEKQKKIDKASKEIIELKEYIKMLKKKIQ